MAELQRASWTTFRFLALCCFRVGLHCKEHPVARSTDSTRDNLDDHRIGTEAIVDGMNIQSLRRTKKTQEVENQEYKFDLNETQKATFELLFGEIEKVKELTTTENLLLEESEREESYLFDILALLCTISYTQASQEYISSLRLVRLLIRLLPAGTPRIQRAVLRLLRRLLPLQNAEQLGSIISPKLSFIHSLFDIIGKAYWPSAGDREQEKKVHEWKVEGADGWRDGFVSISLATEAIMLLRILLVKSGNSCDGQVKGNWKKSLQDALAMALLNIPKIVTVLQNYPLTDNIPKVKYTSLSFSIILLTFWMVLRSTYGEVLQPCA